MEPRTWPGMVKCPCVADERDVVRRSRNKIRLPARRAITENDSVAELMSLESIRTSNRPISNRCWVQHNRELRRKACRCRNRCRQFQVGVCYLADETVANAVSGKTPHSPRLQIRRFKYEFWLFGQFGE